MRGTFWAIKFTYVICLLSFVSPPLQAQPSELNGSEAQVVSHVVPLPSQHTIRQNESSTFKYLLLDSRYVPVKQHDVSFESNAPIEVVQSSHDSAQVEVTLTPTAVGSEALRVVARDKEGSLLYKEYQDVLPARPQRIIVQPAVDSLILGTQKSVKITITTLPQSPVTDLADLRLGCNVGSLGPLVNEGAGVFSTSYELPSTRAPQVAIISVVSAVSSAMNYGWTTISLIGRTGLAYETDPGAKVFAEVGSRRFGPVLADNDGYATVDVEVPPGVMGAEVWAQVPSGATSRTRLALALPAYPRAVLLGSKARQLAGEGLDLFSFAVDSGGLPLNVEDSFIEVDGGTLAEGYTLEPGVRQHPFIMPVQQEDAQLGIKTDGGLTSRPLNLGVPEGRPERLSLILSKSEARIDDGPLTLNVEVLDGKGLPAGLGRLELKASQGSLSQANQVAPGQYIAVYSPPNTLQGEGESPGQTDIEARVYWFPGNRQPESMALYQSSIYMSAEGYPDGMPVVIRVFDEDGFPLANQTLNGQQQSSGGLLSGGTTDSGGWATLTFRPPQQPSGRWIDGIYDLQVLVEERPALNRSFIIIVSSHLPPELRPVSELPVVAGAADVSVKQSLLLKAGLVDRLIVSMMPSQMEVASGQRATLRISLYDSNGNIVLDPQMQVTAEQGKLGAVSIDMKGVHSAIYTPPLEFQGAIDKLTIQGSVDDYEGGTEVELVPRQERWLLGISGGISSNFTSYMGPNVEISTLKNLATLQRDVYLMPSLSYGQVSLDFSSVDGATGRIQSRWISSDFALGLRKPLGPGFAVVSSGFSFGALNSATSFEGSLTSNSLWGPIAGARASLGWHCPVGSALFGATFSAGYLAAIADDASVQGNLAPLSLKLGVWLPLGI